FNCFYDSYIFFSCLFFWVSFRAFWVGFPKFFKSIRGVSRGFGVDEGEGWLFGRVRYRYICLCLCLCLCFILGTRIANRTGNRMGFFWFILGTFGTSPLPSVFRSNPPSFLNLCPSFLHFSVPGEVVVAVFEFLQRRVVVVIVLQFG